MDTKQNMEKIISLSREGLEINQNDKIKYLKRKQLTVNTEDTVVTEFIILTLSDIHTPQLYSPIHTLYMFLISFSK